MSGMTRPMNWADRETTDLRKALESAQSQATSYKVERDRALLRVDQLENECRSLRAGNQEVEKLRNRVATLTQALGNLGIRS